MTQEMILKLLEENPTKCFTARDISEMMNYKYSQFISRKLNKLVKFGFVKVIYSESNSALSKNHFISYYKINNII